MYKLFILIIFLFILTSCSRYNQNTAPVIYGEKNKESVNTRNEYNKNAYIKVMPGDTLESIARKYNLSLPELIKINRIESPFIIHPGDYLKIPQKNIYIVKKGDNLSSISKCLNVHMDSLIISNNLKQPYTLFPGQIIFLPKSSIKSDCKIIIESKISKEEKINIKPKKLLKNLFYWPTNGKVISAFGPKQGGKVNDGINISAAEGAPVRAAKSGTVVYIGNEVPAYGTLIMLRHSDGWTSAYAHLSKILVKKGDIISKNNVIAAVGKTGIVLTPQLHFQLRYESKPVDPLKYLEKR